MHTRVAELNFERNKNIKALGYTIGVVAALFLFFVLLKWSIPVMQQPIADTGVEVNLGNSDQGLGNVPPQIPGPPAEEQQTNYNPPPSRQSAAETGRRLLKSNEKVHL